MVIIPWLSPLKEIEPLIRRWISVYRPRSYKASLLLSIRPINSASSMERATIKALFDFQLTAPLPIIKRYP